MIELLAIDRLRRHVKAALEMQAYTDRRGVLGVPASMDGYQWDANWDVTAILAAVDDAVVLTWSAGDLKVAGRYEPVARHFRLFRPGDMHLNGRDGGAEDVDVQAYNTTPAAAVTSVEPAGWEVTDPSGVVLIRCPDEGIDLADDVYRHSPTGSHLHPVTDATRTGRGRYPVSAGTVSRGAAA